MDEEFLIMYTENDREILVSSSQVKSGFHSKMKSFCQSKKGKISFASILAFALIVGLASGIGKVVKNTATPKASPISITTPSPSEVTTPSSLEVITPSSPTTTTTSTLLITITSTLSTTITSTLSTTTTSTLSTTTTSTLLTTTTSTLITITTSTFLTTTTSVLFTATSSTFMTTTSSTLLTTTPLTLSTITTSTFLTTTASTLLTTTASTLLTTTASTLLTTTPSTMGTTRPSKSRPIGTPRSRLSGPAKPHPSGPIGITRPRLSTTTVPPPVRQPEFDPYDEYAYTVEMDWRTDEIDKAGKDLASIDKPSVPAGGFVLVGLGQTKYGITGDFEVVNLLDPEKEWTFKNFPDEVFAAVGGFHDGLPVICSGVSRRNHNFSPYCYTYDCDHDRWDSFSMKFSSASYGAASVSPLDNNTMLVTGGYDSIPLYDAEYSTKSGWDYSIARLPERTWLHCMVLVNRTTVIAIGGSHGGKDKFSSKTFIFNSDNPYYWYNGPSLNYGRDVPSCGIIKSGVEEGKYSVIVVGGSNGTAMSSVEVLDIMTGVWRMGPDLPQGIFFSKLVEDGRGGVALIGGMSSASVSTEMYLGTIWRLPHAGKDAKWQLYPKSLKVGRHYHVALAIPERILQCSKTLWMKEILMSAGKGKY